MSKKGIIAACSLFLLSCIAVLFFYGSRPESNQKASLKAEEASSELGQKNLLNLPGLPVDQEKEKKEKVPDKSQEAKDAAQEADLEQNAAYELAYDYAHLSLPEVVGQYLDEMGIPRESVAFSYKNPANGHMEEMNATQGMKAGSTYKLPLNMLVVDEVEKKKLNLEDRFDITNTYYEYQGEHDNYVGAFDGAMSIPEMQQYSLVYSENTPAYALADRLGGMDKARKLFKRYGQSKGEIKTFSEENYTTTDYYIQVLEYLYNNKEKYADLLYFIGVSFPDQYYKTFLPDLVIQQKPGYVGEALNVDAIVYETQPYFAAVYTSGLGGTTPESEEVSAIGSYQLGQICYIINEWHRVNMNP